MSTMSWESMTDQQFADLLLRIQNVIDSLQTEPPLELNIEAEESLNLNPDGAWSWNMELEQSTDLNLQAWSMELEQSTDLNLQAYNLQITTTRNMQGGCVESVEFSFVRETSASQDGLVDGSSLEKTGTSGSALEERGIWKFLNSQSTDKTGKQLMKAMDLSGKTETKKENLWLNESIT